MSTSLKQLEDLVKTAFHWKPKIEQWNSNPVLAGKSRKHFLEKEQHVEDSKLENFQFVSSFFPNFRFEKFGGETMGIE